MSHLIERHWGARWRLVLLALLIPLLAVNVAFLWQDHRARRDAIITQVRLKAAQTNSQLGNFVLRVRSVMGVLAADWAEHNPSPSNALDQLAAQAAYLQKVVAERPHFSRAFVTDATGTIQVSSGPSDIGKRVGPPTLYQNAYSSGAFTVSDVVLDSEGRSPFVLFVHPLTWSSATPEGFLVKQSNLPVISGALDMSVGFPKSAKSGIFDSQGRILAGAGYEKPHPGMAVGRDISASQVWKQAKTRPTKAWFGPGLDKVERIIFFRYPKLTPWVTTVAYAQSELFDPLWSRLWILAGALAATLIAVLWVGEILIRRERRGIAELEKERVTLDAVMNEATDGIMVLDAEHRVGFVNRRFGKMFGLQPSSLGGQPINVVRDLMLERTGESGALVAKLQRAVLADGGLVFDNLSLKDTLGLELEMTSYPLKKPNGDQLGRTFVFHDVTEAKALQYMKSHFLATASHQLRTPMTSILIFSELLLTRQTKESQQRRWLESIRAQSERMTQIINSILSVSQLEMGRLDVKLEDVDAQEVCRAIVKDFEMKAGGHKFEIHIPEPIRWIRADRGRFGQIIENLVDNAVKYSPGSGTVTIAASTAQDGMVEFRVSDMGVGIGPDNLKDLFMPFYRIPDDRTTQVPGTGLGLFIAKSLTELQGGMIRVESRPNAGTSFYFTLPASRGGQRGAVHEKEPGALRPAAGPAV